MGPLSPGLSSVTRDRRSGSGGSDPFCSCSAVPLFIGCVFAGVSLVLLFGLVGWQVAAIYLGWVWPPGSCSMPFSKETPHETDQSLWRRLQTL